MEIWVITGGIGSGKSEVCRILRRHGISAQYDADSRVKALYNEVPGLLSSIETALSCNLKDENGFFQTRKLAEIIFSDSYALKKVEGIVFPALTDDFNAFLKRNHDEAVVIFESATILEKPYFEGFGDKIILVDAPFEIRLQRACTRDGISEDAVRARMANQELMNRLSEGVTDPRIDLVIMNDGTAEELEHKIAALLQGCLKTEY